MRRFFYDTENKTYCSILSQDAFSGGTEYYWINVFSPNSKKLITILEGKEMFDRHIGSTLLPIKENYKIAGLLLQGL